MTIRCILSRVFTVTIMTAAQVTQAQSVKPQEELRASVGGDMLLPATAPTAFGERVNPLTGELRLVQTEAVLDGAGPALGVTRQFTPGDTRNGWPRTGAFADWELALPRIVTLSAKYADGHGWRVPGSIPFARCSAFAAPAKIDARPAGERASGTEPIVVTPGSGVADSGTALEPAAIDANVWWHGYHLELPGADRQEVLARAPENPLAPRMNWADGSPMHFPLVTAGQWQFACLGRTDSNEPGEAFLAVAPDGTKYTFNHMAYTWAPGLQLDGIGTIERVRASLLPTRVEDRFGNVLTYSYDGARLIGLRRDDDAEVRIDYRADHPSLVDKITLRPDAATPRVWAYAYEHLGTGRETLSTVTHPDGTVSRFNLRALAEASMTFTSAGTCRAPGNVHPEYFTGEMTGPTGLRTHLRLLPLLRGRTGVAEDCESARTFPWQPPSFYVFALADREYSGAGMDAMAWQYRNSPFTETPAWSETIDPDKRVTRLTISNRADETEGQVSAVQIDRRADGVAMRDTSLMYAGAQQGPYPARLGASPRSRINVAATGVITPLRMRSILQESDTYTTENKAFDVFGKPTRVSRGNSIKEQPSLELGMAYLDDLPHWVLGLPTIVTDLADGTEISRIVYDAASLTVAERYQFGQKQASYTFSAQGLLTSSTDGNGLTTRYQNHVLGFPGTIIHADGLRESRSIDAFGNIVSSTDRAGITTTTDYDAMGRVTRLGTPKGDSVAWNDTTLHYDLAPAGTQFGGYASRTITKHGNVQENVYHDALGRSALVHRYVWDTSERTSTRFAYDWRGATVFASYPMDGELHRDSITKGTYTDVDGLGRTVKTERDSELGRLVGTISYLQGAGVRSTDPKGAVTTTRYQVLDTPDHGGAIEVTAPEGIQQSIVRDAFGLPRQIAQYGAYQDSLLIQTRKYVYDEYRRLCRTIDPESQSSVVDYDAGNRPVWSAQGVAVSGDACGREQVAAGLKTTTSYDTMNRVTAITHADGSASSAFGYDAVGRVIQANAGITEWSYAYNALGLVTRETLAVEGLNFGLAYGYDANGSLTNAVYPDGRIVDYAPDGLGRPSKAGSYASAARYHPNGELAYFKYGNGIEYLSEQNARLAPGNLSYAKPGGGLLFSQDLAYDANGNLTKATDLADGASSSRTFAYDAIDRLTNATLPNLWDTESYRYDPLNNIRGITSGTGVQRTYQYDGANRLISAQGSNGQAQPFAYDPRGNVVQKAGTPFTFDMGNRLVEVSGKERYAYDAFGRRVLKTRLGIGGAKTYYVYSRQGALLQERDNDTSSSVTDYVYLGGMLVAQMKTRKVDMPGAISFTPGSPTNGVYTVAWGKSDGVEAYELEEQHDGGAWTQVYRGVATSFSYPPVVLPDRPGGTYVYRLRACSGTCGNWVISSPMGVSSQRIKQFTFPQGVQKTDYQISWAVPHSATAYDIDEGETNRNGELIWTRVATGHSQNYIVRPGNRVGTYQYRVTARNAFGERGWSYPPIGYKVVVDPGESGPPAKPRVTAPTSGMRKVRFPYNLRVAWDPVARVTVYRVRTNWPLSCDTAGTECVFSATRAGDYAIRVSACNNDGCSAEGLVVVTLTASGGVPTIKKVADTSPDHASAKQGEQP